MQYSVIHFDDTMLLMTALGLGGFLILVYILCEVFASLKTMIVKVRLSATKLLSDHGR